MSQKILNMPRNVKNVPMKKGSFLCISRTNFFCSEGVVEVYCCKNAMGQGTPPPG